MGWEMKHERTVAAGPRLSAVDRWCGNGKACQDLFTSGDRVHNAFQVVGLCLRRKFSANVMLQSQWG